MRTVDISAYLYHFADSGKRRPLKRLDTGELVCAVDYADGQFWGGEVEQFWPVADPSAPWPKEAVMDQNILQFQGGNLVVVAENQYNSQFRQLASARYQNAIFAPSKIPLGYYRYPSKGSILWSNGGPDVRGIFNYLTEWTVTPDETGELDLTVMESWWQAMEDTDPEQFKSGIITNPISYKRLQRFTPSGLVFVHDLLAKGWPGMYGVAEIKEA